MSHFSIPRSGLVGEFLLDSNANDTNDGTKNNGTATNVTYSTCGVGYQKQCGSFNGSSSRISVPRSASYENSSGEIQVVFSTSNKSNQGLLIEYGNTINSDRNGFVFWRDASGYLNFEVATASTYYRATYSTDVSDGKNHCALCRWDGSNVYILLDGIQVASAAQSSAITWSTDGIYIGGETVNGSRYFNGNISTIRVWNRVLTDTERLQLWHEFNRNLGGGSDFGAYVPAPTAQFEADGSNTFVDVAAQGTVTRTSGSAATDSFGITRAISAPNQSWSSVSGDSFVFWNNSGWKLEKNATGVSATGINTANTVQAVLFYPASSISTAQQTYLENCFKSGRYPYAFRRSIPANIRSKLRLHYAGYQSGTTVYDMSGNGNNGTSVGSPTIARSQQNPCLLFNGSSQYVNGPTFDTGNDFAVSCWFKPTTTASEQVFFSNAQGSGSSLQGFFFLYDSSNKLRLTEYMPSFSNRDLYTGTLTLTANKWYLCTCVIRGGTVYEIYLNDHLEAKQTGTDKTSYNQASRFGSYSHTTASYITGPSECFVWNTAPSQQEIQQLYYATHRN